MQVVATPFLAWLLIPEEGHHRCPAAAEGYGVGRELRLLQGSPAVG